MAPGKLIFRVHAIRRMVERRLDVSAVRRVVEEGEIIEDYPDDLPYPSRLLLGWSDGRPVHTVVAYNKDDDEFIVVTVYEPDPAEWNQGFRKRRP